MKRISVILPVLAPDPVLQSMTQHCINTLRANADHEFELVVVEAENNHFYPRLCDRGSYDGNITVSRIPESEVGKHCHADTYLRFNPKIGGVREINAGIRAAGGEFIVTAGNDVMVPPHWDTHLVRCFEERQDCGIAALSAYEPGAIIGPPTAQDLIVEGMYSPFNMFRKGWFYDEDYLRVYQDSDLILRMYEAGLRAYRSCRAHVHHLLRMTNDAVGTAAHNIQLGKDERLFYSRWGRSPLMIFAMIRYGQYTYGQEWQSFTTPINLHYDPNQPG